MMNVECPKCHVENEDIGESLPDLSCDDAEYDCVHCGHTFFIGWTAEVDVRHDNLPAEPISFHATRIDHG